MLVSTRAALASSQAYLSGFYRLQYDKSLGDKPGDEANAALVDTT